MKNFKFLFFIALVTFLASEQISSSDVKAPETNNIKRYGKELVAIQTRDNQSIQGYYHIPKNPIVSYTHLK